MTYHLLFLFASFFFLASAAAPAATLFLSPFSSKPSYPICPLHFPPPQYREWKKKYREGKRGGGKKTGGESWVGGGNKYGPGTNKSDWKWPMSDREFLAAGSLPVPPLAPLPPPLLSFMVGSFFLSFLFLLLSGAQKGKNRGRGVGRNCNHLSSPPSRIRLLIYRPVFMCFSFLFFSCDLRRVSWWEFLFFFSRWSRVWWQK